MLAKVGGLMLHVAEPREIEQFFRDLLATKGLRLDHSQITADDSGWLAFGGRDFRQSAFERLGAHRDRRQRIVDFMSDSGRQKPDARQLLAPTPATWRSSSFIP